MLYESMVADLPCVTLDFIVVSNAKCYDDLATLQERRRLLREPGAVESTNEIGGFVVELCITVPDDTGKKYDFFNIGTFAQSRYQKFEYVSSTEGSGTTMFPSLWKLAEFTAPAHTIRKTSNRTFIVYSCTAVQC